MKTANALLLAGLLALSACSAPTAVTPPTAPAPVTTTKPNPARSFGLYELRVNGLSGQGQASVHRAGSALDTQAAEIPFEQLSFTRTNMVNLVDEVNKVVHMTATFSVTNNTGSAITLPTFIPVDTDGSYATDGSSAFRMVKTRTGAPVSAAGMAVEVAHTNSGGTIAPDPTATPFLTNLDSAGVTLNLPTDTTAPNISHRGWQSASLAAGASQLVTFAARVPLQGTQISDADPFSFNLVFAVADNPGTVAGLRGIYEVQGSTPSGNVATPLSGQAVTVEGVVTSVNTASGTGSLQGFFIQEEVVDSDGINTTSDGVFVYCATTCPADLAVGERVRVTGTASEFSTATQIGGTLTVTRLGTGAPLPDTQALTLPLPFAQREQYEGMRVTVSGKVTNNFPLGRFGSFDIADARITNFTQLNAPNAAANAAYQVAAKDRYIRIDDGTRAQNPDPEIFARGGQPLSAANTLRGGDTVTATGVLTFSNDGANAGSGGSLDTYRIHATQAGVQITDTNPRQNAPDNVLTTAPTNGQVGLRVGSMNVLNYFTTLLTSNSGCTPNGTGSISRGANDCDEFTRQQTKIVKAILGLNTDVLGILEAQNDFDKGANSSVALLVNALNAEAGAGTYAYINPGRNIGTDAISVAMIYKAAAVEAVGTLAILDNTFSATYADTCNRPTWAQTFQSKANGGRFTAVMMHLKSKGSACAATSDADTGDGQGNGYIARRNAATALVNWLATNPTGVTEDDRILLGDYNAYAQEEPLTILASGGYANLFENNVYSYQFDGQWGSLDQATASASMTSQVVGKTKWHINADEPIVLDYNKEFKTPGQVNSFYSADPFRSSDHDPILVGLNLNAQAPINPPGQTTSISLTPASSTVSVTAGASTTNTINVSRTNFTGSVTLGVDSVTGTGTAPVVTVTTQPDAGNSGTLSVNATGATAGTYTVTVRGTGTGVSDTTATFTVSVNSVTTNAGVFFSEYVEGTSNNKAIEIYNGSGQTIPANQVVVNLYSNGATTVGNTYTIAVPLNPGQTFVITNASAGTALAAKSNATSNVTNFNGDDALSLVLNGTVVDTFGQIGNDPGSAWTGGSLSTLDRTLRRKTNITTGDVNGSDAFDPSVEWDGFPIDTFDGLGSR
ncbi:ExeM/NucH family extracellular endonuclease [Deinococcus sp. HMF7604]|uniref:ExeM/NucH family extracellular endonuclease n=1 Tax=Deinococcus betulae TaxID=2873312 RepID=UPI001CCF16AC|nr:ExeM/NucH family extracellular endonuclease [Deinococcus betulae]MBZ9751352.1 ExeM/NucH family extracellular endonuclease [Deinococcus betulae]